MVALHNSWFSELCVIADINVSSIYKFLVSTYPRVSDTTGLEKDERDLIWSAAYTSIKLETEPLTKRSALVLINTSLLYMISIFLVENPILEPAVLNLAMVTDWPMEVLESVEPTPFRLGNFTLLTKVFGLFERSKSVIDGFQHGFRIGYKGTRETRWKDSAVPVDKEARAQLAAQIHEEVQDFGRMIGPLPPRVPAWLKYVMVSPVSLIPKKAMGVIVPKKFRLIFNLSWGKLFGLSVNDGIDNEDFEVCFITFDEVCRLARTVGFGGWVWKDDLRHAFRIAPMHPDDIPLLGLAYNQALYLETRLPFGVRSGPCIFANIAEPIRDIYRSIISSNLLANMQDDFFNFDHSSDFVANTLSLTGFGCLLDTLGMESAPGKAQGPDNIMVILGLEVDMIEQRIKVPEPRMKALKALLVDWEGRAEATKVQLQSLVGVLQFCSYGVQWGRAFLRRLIDLASPLPLQTSSTALDEFTKLDISWWIKYASMPAFNGITYMIDPTPMDLELQIWGDSSRPCCAGVWPSKEIWWCHDFTEIELKQLEHINGQELFTILVNCATFGSQLRGKTVLVLSDNAASVERSNQQHACKESRTYVSRP